MHDQIFEPPQPIPYPENSLLKNLYRLPILLYRLGLGPLIGKYILVLSTFGRKSGRIHRTPVEYFQHQGRIYVMSGFANRPDWFKNLQADPHTGMNIKNHSVCAKARPPHSEAEWDSVIAFLKSSPVAQFSEPGMESRLDDPEVRESLKTWPVLTFDPIEEPCPPPLEADLLWAWPLILLAAAMILLLTRLRRRKA